ncbi:alpha/beta hydrolase [Streptomyces sp. NPDC058595]|uniref:alpha/beta hydrolase n=1 Tax=Streptomyces sp. NPDC058595 TaxID=3346550 RepID=UPI003669981A
MRVRIRRARAVVVLAALAALLPPAGPASPADRVPVARVAGERVVSERAGASGLVDLTVDSPALGRRAAVRLATPDGWDERRPGDRWPVLYLLPGGDGDHLSWTRDYGVQDLSELRNVLVVMPEMPLFGFYTNWWNGGAGGPPGVERFHLDEVRPLLEREYGAGTRRTVAGESQGGFGALSYSARRPGMFRAAASFSGYVHPLRHPHAVKAGMDHLGLDWKAIWGDPVEQRANWVAHDPYYLAERLRGMPVRLSAGDGTAGVLDPPDVEPDEEIPGLEDPADPFDDDVISPTETLMERESRAVADRLRKAGARVTTHFYPGTHSPVYWERELHHALPMLLKPLVG